MLTKGRVSLMIAAGGLLLVGLLAAALFAPSGSDEETKPVAKKTEKPVKLDAVVNPAKSLGAHMGAPTITPEATSPKPSEAPKVEPPKETRPAIIDYKVQPGDMVAKIAKKHGCKVEDIYRLNEGLNAQTASKIRVGQVLKVPNGPGAVVEASGATDKPEEKGFARRVVKAEAGDTAFSLAIEYYGARSMFRVIMEANPTLPWSDRLKGGEEVILPEYGQVEKAPEPVKETSTEKPKATVERDGLIPARR